MRHPMHYLTIPARNRLLQFFGRPSEADFLCKQERDLQCIFFHLPKTGGLAICEALFGGFHVNHRLYVKCERQDPISLRRYWKFCVMRDPIDRFLSAFHFLKAGGITEMDYQFRTKHAEAFETPHTFIEAFRNQENIRRFVHFRPQADFICDSGGAPRMDFIGRFEQFPETFDHITRHLQISTTLPVVNRGPSKSEENSLTVEEKEYILSFYDKDVQILSTIYPQ